MFNDDDFSDHSISSGVRAGEALGERPEGNTDTDDPDRQAVYVGDEPVDMTDHDAIAYALSQGRRDLIDPSQLSLQERMRFGLLTKADDEARVKGELGNFASTGQDGTVGGAERTNVGENLPGRE